MVEYGEVGEHSHDILCTWQLPWLAKEQSWSALAGPFLTLLTQIGTEPPFTTCRTTISGSVCSFPSGGSFAGRNALASSLMSGCG